MFNYSSKFQSNKGIIILILCVLAFTILCLSLFLHSKDLYSGNNTNEKLQIYSYQDQGIIKYYTLDKDGKAIPYVYGEQTEGNNIMFAITVTCLLIAIALVIYFILASKKNHNRCPKCKMRDDYVIISEHEISHDTHKETRSIQRKIKDTNGQIIKTVEELGHVDICTSVIQQERKCKNCYEMWTVVIKKRIQL